jgi:ABC-type amino acid transport substrate-binding protein
MKSYERGEVRLTGAGKLLLIVIGLGVIGYAAWTYWLQPRMAPKAQVATDPVSSAPGTSSPVANGAGDAAGKGAVLTKVRSSGVVRVGMEPDAPPLHFLNARKQEDGFDFRLAGLLAESIGTRRVQVVEADYEELPGKLATGEIDLLMGGYVPDSSIRGVEWSIGYLDFGLCLIVNTRDVGVYRAVADLTGKRIAVYDDPAAVRWVQDNIPGAVINKFSGDKGWFEALEDGAVDALVYDYPFAAEEIKAHPKTVIARYNLNSSKYAVGVAKGNYDLLAAINTAIDSMRSTPAYADLMREYLSSSSEAFTKAIPGRKTYTVAAGDTLSKIAAAQLGSQDRWRQIWDLNRDRVANENLIYPRLVLLMP